MFDPYSEGYQRYLCGLPLSACPYDRSSHQATEWKHGWMDAEEDVLKRRKNMDDKQRIQQLETALAHARHALILWTDDPHGDLRTDAIQSADRVLERAQPGVVRDGVGGVLLEQAIDRACQHLPDGFEIQLNMEKDAAFITLSDESGFRVPLNDSADKTLTEELDDALCVAKGWNSWGRP